MNSNIVETEILNSIYVSFPFGAKSVNGRLISDKKVYAIKFYKQCISITNYEKWFAVLDNIPILIMNSNDDVCKYATIICSLEIYVTYEHHCIKYELKTTISEIIYKRDACNSHITNMYALGLQNGFFIKPKLVSRYETRECTINFV